MKKIYVLSLFFCFVIASAQNDANNAQNEENTEEKKEKKWKMGGNFSFLINQASFNSEWLGGGTSNYSANVLVSYDINYKNEKVTWDTKLLGDYGITRTKDQDFNRKTNDRLEVNSVAGYQMGDSKWSYSTMLNFRTQFANGYTFGEDELGNETRSLETELMSPAFLQLGLGALWKESDDFRVNISPATGRLIFASSKFTSTPGYVDGDFFGLDEGETVRTEFGASLNAYGKFKLMNNITMENFLNLFSNYMEDPQNVDIDYTLNLVLKVNDYISTNFTFQAIYDDNAVKGFQIRQVLGVGLAFQL
ncbi:DUF3078 domain-containing protein [Psychroflexus planctonicus]|uniref:DUF3078 domain-containing protein n=1 Tax=Psychroflexus planctonicus TaxID=1526575 RepID=A0ABQ1SIP1_9FLAO|nr:DUF3078 domain-containing protein [Psychroflexus planctonicus]GGE38118.1 protein of unknown function precursor [Psychroflexus planctonicus]